jgi:hypothetical protein
MEQVILAHKEVFLAQKEYCYWMKPVFLVRKEVLLAQKGCYY